MGHAGAGELHDGAWTEERKGGVCSQNIDCPHAMLARLRLDLNCRLLHTLTKPPPSRLFCSSLRFLVLPPCCARSLSLTLSLTLFVHLFGVSAKRAKEIESREGKETVDGADEGG